MKSAELFRFRLHVTVEAPISVRALTDGILMTPTLVKRAPGVQQRIVGSLSDLPPLRASLGLSSP